jgi:hypothetical protein
MNYKIILGVFYGILGQVATFLQLQCSYKYDWNKKYFWLVLLSSIPIGWFFIKSTNYLIDGYDGQIWPSRLIGFGIGVIVFTWLSVLIFNEPLTLKSYICLFLGLLIILTQIFL